MTNGIPVGTKKGIVYQVTESNADKYRAVEDGNAFTELKGSVTLANLKGKTIHDDGFLFCDSGAWVKDIVPIPLTSEILEKNGWSREDGAFGVSPDFKKIIDDPARKKGYITYLSVYPFFDNDGFSFFYNNQKLATIHHVHELQHILFGLSINHEMEV